MDDFSKLQKITNLARELMKHGQAATMDIAMKMAKQQLESGMVSEFVSGSAPAPASAVLQAAPLPEVSASVALPQGVSSEDIVNAVERLVGEQQTVLSRMTTVVNSHTNQLQNLNTRVNEVVARLNSIIADIASIKEDVARLKESPITPPMRPKEAKQGQTQFKEPSSSAPAGEGSHVRTGKYNPDDVSIEKFFYYGGGVTKK